MRSFLLLTSLMALVLGFAGTAMGVRPRPAAADTAAVERQLASLEAQVSVLTQALEDLDRRFDDHRARTPVEAADRAAADDPGDETGAGKADAPAADTTPSALVLAALERAEDHVLAGDARGARDLFRALLDGSNLTPELRVRARLGVARSWESLEAWAEATVELDRASKVLGSAGNEVPESLRAEVRDLRKRIDSHSDED